MCPRTAHSNVTLTRQRSRAVPLSIIRSTPTATSTLSELRSLGIAPQVSPFVRLRSSNCCTPFGPTASVYVPGLVVPYVTEATVGSALTTEEIYQLREATCRKRKNENNRGDPRDELGIFTAWLRGYRCSLCSLPAASSSSQQTPFLNRCTISEVVGSAFRCDCFRVAWRQRPRAWRGCQFCTLSAST